MVLQVGWIGLDWIGLDWDWIGLGLDHWVSRVLTGVRYRAPYGAKNAILDGCSTVDSKLDYDGIGWYSMVFDGIAWYSMVFCY